MTNMLLNGKPVNEWTEDDLSLLINNPDFRESETIDYKVCFAFSEITDKLTIQHKKDEFRHDICSFANSIGGIMFFGISEENGVATSLAGISIENNNTDAFESRLKDLISKIKPVVPLYEIYFVKLKNGNYIVLLKIDEGIYKPYVNQENHDFKFVTRRGNGKVCLNYAEVKLMFNESLKLSEQIDQFRNGRIEKCLAKEGLASVATIESFSLVHIIPQSAFANRYLSAPYIEKIQDRKSHDGYFSKIGYGSLMPNVDGVAFSNKQFVKDDIRYLQLFKNGIIEKYIPLPQQNSSSYISIRTLCKEVRNVYEEAINYYDGLHIYEAFYICVSVLNCKGYCTDDDVQHDYQGTIDRNRVICTPIEINQIENKVYVQNMINKVLINLCHSVGIFDANKFINSLF
jgi:hypothetical protein